MRLINDLRTRVSDLEAHIYRLEAAVAAILRQKMPEISTERLTNRQIIREVAFRGLSDEEQKAD
jgi:hypothetical protein